MNRLGKFLQRLLLGVSILCALLLVGSWLSVKVSPLDVCAPALLGLLFPWTLLVNVLFLIYFLFFHIRYSVVPGIAILLCFPLLVRYFQFRSHSPEFNGQADLRIVSYNVNLFRLYAWSKQEPTFSSIASLCHELKAHVLCFQEFYTHDTIFSPTQALALFADTGHVHYIEHRGGGHYGLATFSQYPIVSSGEIYFEESANATIFTDIRVKQDTIRIYNTHLQSFRFNSHNLAFIRNPKLKMRGETVLRLRSLRSQLQSALTKRAQQVEKVKAHIERSPYPVIVCGDFNDSPVSYTYFMMRSSLEDAFCKVGDGFGATYSGLTPSFRIDYILYDPKAFTPLDFATKSVNFSDHYPIVGLFNIH